MDRGELAETVIEKRGANCSYCGVWRRLTTGFEDKVDNDNACSMRIVEKCESCGSDAYDIWAVDEDY